MSKRIFLLALILSTILTLSFGQEIDYKGFPQWSWHKQDSTEYYLYTPSDVRTGNLYPIVLFLHGCCGSSYHATLRNTIDPPVRMWHNFGENTQSQPTYILAPATSRGWKQHFENLKMAIDDLIKNHQGDPSRIYITGFSMGGDGTIGFINKYPDYFAAALPMGMDIRGDLQKIKNIPIWTNRGETDWFSRNLKTVVSEMRRLNGDNVDSSGNWVTGVNPRFTEFRGVGHGVQWDAARKQDLIGWAYSKTNDGNAYPQVFFSAPSYKTVVEAGKPVRIMLNAKDPDGQIKKIEIYVNGHLIKTLTHPPYTTTVMPIGGDTKVEATVFDDKGKSSTATTILKINDRPSVTTSFLPPAQQGAYYSQKIIATGNGTILFSWKGPSSVRGLRLYPDGNLSGVPITTGRFPLVISSIDEDGDETVSELTLTITGKNSSEVLILWAQNNLGTKFPISKIRKGETPNFDSKDTLRLPDLEEINFSNVGKFEGLTYIKTDVQDTARKEMNYLSFETDEALTVMVAYEKRDKTYSSTTPDWLKGFKKTAGAEIVAQYFYYDIYEKSFPKGIITLPGADEKRNHVQHNYFVMVKKPAGK
jgi:dienelactone hydrolase